MSDIHSTVPPESKRIDWTELKAAIMTVLLPGKSFAINSDDIAERINVKHTRTNQHIRRACKMLLEDDMEPVISSHKGFYLAKDTDELQEYYDSICSRMKGLQRVLNAVNKLQEKFDYMYTLFEEERV